MKYHLDVRANGNTYAQLETDSFREARKFYMLHYTNYDNCIVVHVEGKRIRFPRCWKLFDIGRLSF